MIFFLLLLFVINNTTMMINKSIVENNQKEKTSTTNKCCYDRSQKQTDQHSASKFRDLQFFSFFFTWPTSFILSLSLFLYLCIAIRECVIIISNLRLQMCVSKIVKWCIFQCFLILLLSIVYCNECHVYCVCMCVCVLNVEKWEGSPTTVPKPR